MLLVHVLVFSIQLCLLYAAVTSQCWSIDPGAERCLSVFHRFRMSRFPGEVNGAHLSIIR